MSRRPTLEPHPGRPASDSSGEIPPEHAITRLYVLPTDAAAAFTEELENVTEEPTPALRALLRGAER